MAGPGTRLLRRRRSSGTPGGPAPRSNTGLGGGRAERLARIALPRRRLRRRAAASGISARSMAHGSGASARTTATAGRCSRWATPSRRPPIARWSPPPPLSSIRRCRWPRAHLTPRGGVGRVGVCRVLDSNPADARPPCSRSSRPDCDRFRRHSTPDWPWPEVSVTYENAVLPRALIIAGRILSRSRWSIVACARSTGSSTPRPRPTGHLSPVGNKWWARDGEMSHFDQQPIEATALLLAAEAAYAVTGGIRYAAAMERCVCVVPRRQRPWALSWRIPRAARAAMASPRGQRE